MSPSCPALWLTSDLSLETRGAETQQRHQRRLQSNEQKQQSRGRVVKDFSIITVPRRSAAPCPLIYLSPTHPSPRPPPHFSLPVSLVAGVFSLGPLTYVRRGRPYTSSFNGASPSSSGGSTGTFILYMCGVPRVHCTKQLKYAYSWCIIEIQLRKEHRDT